MVTTVVIVVSISHFQDKQVDWPQFWIQMSENEVGFHKWLVVLPFYHLKGLEAILSHT